MADAYGVDLVKPDLRALLGLPIEEIEIKMELDRLKQNVEQALHKASAWHY
jgi:hypothetical protein